MADGYKKTATMYWLSTICTFVANKAVPFCKLCNSGQAVIRIIHRQKANGINAVALIAFVQIQIVNGGKMICMAYGYYGKNCIRGRHPLCKKIYTCFSRILPF